MATMVISNAAIMKIAAQKAAKPSFIDQAFKGIVEGQKSSMHDLYLGTNGYYVNQNIAHSPLPTLRFYRTIFCIVSSGWTTRGSSDLLQNRTHQLTRNIYKELSLMDNKEKVRVKRKGIHQDVKTIWMTRRRFINVKYFKGFTTAMYPFTTIVGMQRN